ncbi:MAG: serine/threonine protein kinase, partial [Actinomycetota bacterium]|nr:serine/threonine protein kinase [Actinomycetota bacterium]
MRDTPVPEVIADRYELGGLLGRGGMGEVRDGLDRRLGRPVAVKLLRRDLAAEPELRRRFEAEARAAAPLTHPNVVAVYDTGEQDDVPYIVMERLAGRTVADEMVEGPLEPARVERLAREVLAALDVAHRAGVVHRDIKPGNLLLTPDSSVKVADFGIAKVAEALGPDVTMTGEVVGTPAYLAPERLEGRPATASSDLYSLGVVLYEALSGTKPYSGDTPWGLAQAVMAGQHRPLDEVAPGLPPALVAATERALATLPGDRFATAADMAASLHGDGSATRAIPHTSRPQTERMPTPPAEPAGERRSAAPRRLLAWKVPAAAAAAVLLVVILLIALSGSRDRDPAPTP